MTTTVTVELKGIDDVLAVLRSLPPEVASKRGGPVRTALRKGALVVFKEAKANLQRVTANATAAEGQQNTKLLEQNLVIQRGKPPSGVNGEVFLVKIRRKKYDRKSAKAVTTIRTGNALEYGTSKQPAEPWLRPAFKTKSQLALETILKELRRALDRAVRKASKGKGGLT